MVQIFKQAAVLFFLISCASPGHDKKTNKPDDISSVTLNAWSVAMIILDSSIAAHGGMDKIKALEIVSFEYNGIRHMINQSRKADGPPWDKEPSVGKVVADLKNKKLYSFGSNSYPGIGAFGGAWVVNGDEGFHYEPAKNYMGNEIMKLSGDDIHSPWNYFRRWMPPFLLLQAMENKNNLRWIGTFEKNDLTLEAVNFAQPHGLTMTLLFNASTHLLYGYETIRDDGVHGDVTETVRFEEYKDFSGVMLPVKRIDLLNEMISRELPVNITVNAKTDETLFDRPKNGYAEYKEDKNYQRIQKIADGIYFDKDMGGIVFIEFKDYVLVLDCPGNFQASQSTINEIRKTIPGKPVRYIVTSHTHGDHGGGVRAYYYTGATLITTPGHLTFYKKLARIKQTINRDSLTISPKEPIIEAFADKKIITDEIQTVELYNADPNAHSEELTFAYLPRQKILWQADIFFVPGAGNGINKAMPITIEFAKKLKLLKLDNFEFIIDSHNSRLISRKQFKESLRLAGYNDF